MRFCQVFLVDALHSNFPIMFLEEINKEKKRKERNRTMKPKQADMSLTDLNRPPVKCELPLYVCPWTQQQRRRGRSGLSCWTQTSQLTPWKTTGREVMVVMQPAGAGSEGELSRWNRSTGPEDFLSADKSHRIPKSYGPHKLYHRRKQRQKWLSATDKMGIRM